MRLVWFDKADASIIGSIRISLIIIPAAKQISEAACDIVHFGFLCRIVSVTINIKSSPLAKW